MNNLRLATASFVELSNFEGRKAKFCIWLCNWLNNLFGLRPKIHITKNVNRTIEFFIEFCTE